MHLFENTCDLTIDVRWESGRLAVVDVSGDLDDHSTPRLRAVLAELSGQMPARVVLDCDRVSHFCCAAVSQMLVAREGLPGGLVIVRPSRPVQRILSVLGLFDSLVPAGTCA